MNKLLLGIMFTVMIPVLLGSAQQADAANLFIDDSVEGQITLNPDANFEGGFVGGGLVLGESAAASGTWIAPGAGSPHPGTGVIYFVDPSNPNVVSDIVTASWSGTFFTTINFNIQSTTCGGDLGPLPTAFVGLGVTEPVAGAIQIGSLFRDPTTGAPVGIPSNLTIQFLSSDDSQCPPVGGELIPIHITSLLLAYTQSFSWMIPVTLSILGIGLFVVSRKSENS